MACLTLVSVQERTSHPPGAQIGQSESTEHHAGLTEHSSFFELTCFALSLDYVKMIPTVNVHTETSRNKMKMWMTRWMDEKKRRADAKIPRMVPPRSESYF